MRLLTITFLIASTSLFAQDVTETFNSTRIVNCHSTESLGLSQWEYRIEHRFGDFAGAGGGAQTAFGFDQAADIRFAFENGINERWMVGFARNKGINNPYRSLLEGFSKFQLARQNKERKMPISASLNLEGYYTYMEKSTDPESVSFFPRDIHRFSFASQLIVARKMSDRLSLALIPSYIHRNYVANNDVNGLFSIGGAMNMKLTKSMGVVLEYFYNLEPGGGLRPNAINSLGIGYEFITNGHNFTINLTNARGFGAVQYIALNQSDWLQGQFRLGFSIARTFKIRRK